MKMNRLSQYFVLLVAQSTVVPVMYCHHYYNSLMAHFICIDKCEIFLSKMLNALYNYVVEMKKYGYELFFLYFKLGERI